MPKGLVSKANKKTIVKTIRIDQELQRKITLEVKVAEKNNLTNINDSEIMRRCTVKVLDNGGLFNRMDNQLKEIQRMIDQTNKYTNEEIVRIVAKARRFTLEINAGKNPFESTVQKNNLMQCFIELKEIKAVNEFEELYAALKNHVNKGNNYSLENFYEKMVETKRKESEATERILEKKAATEKKEKAKKLEKQPEKKKPSREEQLETLRKVYQEMTFEKLETGMNDPHFKNLPKDEQELVYEVYFSREKERPLPSKPENEKIEEVV